jgi:LacI family transcriptional regulator
MDAASGCVPGMLQLDVATPVRINSLSIFALERPFIEPSKHDMNMPSEGLTRGSEEVGPENRRSVTKDEAAKVVTMATVARVARCSQGAISSLLNDRDYGIRVSPKTRDRIFKTCRELGYIPNDLRAFVRIYPEQGSTCLMVSDKVHRGFENPFVARLAAAVMAHASLQSTGIGLIVYNETREYEADTDLPSPIKNWTASRILWVGIENESIGRVVHDRGLPGIALGHSSQTPGIASILPDYTGAAHLALGLLVGRGHRHVGVVSGPFGEPETRHAEMTHAIASAAHEKGLTFEAENVFHGNLTFEAGVAAVTTMRGRSAAPTALVCLTESAATGVLAAAHQCGIRVPEELSVITFADHAGPLDACIPLTAVVLPVSEMASAAVSEANRQLSEGIPSTATKITIPVQLIERATCGPVGE